MGGNMVNFPVTAFSMHGTSDKTSSYLGKVCERAEKRINYIIKDLDENKSLDSAESYLEELLNILPGSLTPEKLKRIDQDFYIDWKKIAKNQYPTILDLMLNYVEDIVKEKRTHFNALLSNLFKIDHNYNFTIENLKSLTKFSNSKLKNTIVLKFLEEMIFDDIILSYAFIDISYNNQHSSKFDLSYLEADSSEFIKLLISIPNKVANELKNLFKESLFHPDIYVRFLLFKINFSLNFIAEINAIEKMDIFNVVFISNLLSEIIINFNSNRKSEYILNALKVFSCWSEDVKYKHLINNLFLKLKRQAIEIISVMLLETQSNIYMILDNAVLISDDWNYVLTTKIPLLNFYTNQNLIENLILYLAIISDDKSEKINKILINLLKELMDIWSSNTSLSRTSFGQRVYIAKLIILIIQYIMTMKTYKIDENLKNEIRSRLFHGMSLHLNSANIKIQCLGMITTEIILKILENNPEAENLTFDYSRFSIDDRNLVEHLQELPQRCKFLNENLFELNEKNTNEIVYEILNIENNELEKFISHKQNGNIINEINESDYKIDVILKNNKIIDSKNDVKICELKRTILVTDSNFNEEIVDSDDDLTPYDMSNDCDVKILKRPKYLLDLKDCLLETEDSEVFQQSMEVLEELIEEQLINNDESLAIDLVNLLISLEMKFYTEKFEEYRFRSLVAVCCVYPQQIATYLSNEIHSEVGKYSISKKILMLNILSETARKLSKLDIIEENKENLRNNRINRLLLKTPSDRKKEAKAIINKRLLNKTTYFATKTPDPCKNGKINEFAKYAGWFFFPLISQFGKNQLIFLKDEKLKYDPDNQLILTFLHTIATIMRCSENCPIAPSIAQEILNITTFLRFNSESEIRWAVMHLIFSILITLTPEIIVNDFYQEFYEIRTWLNNCIQSNILHRESNEECRHLAQQILILLEKLFYNSE